MSFPPHDPNYPDVDPATGDERETEPNIPETVLTSDTSRSTVPEMKPSLRPIRANRWVVAWRDDAAGAPTDNVVTMVQEADAHFLISALTALGIDSTITPHVFYPISDLLP